MNSKPGSSNKTQITSLKLVLWLPFKGKSLNKSRYLHWSDSRKSVKQGAEIWLSSLRSCPSAVECLMTIISRVHSKDYGTLLRNQSALMTETAGTDGNTDKLKRSARKEPS